MMCIFCIVGCLLCICIGAGSLEAEMKSMSKFRSRSKSRTTHPAYEVEERENKLLIDTLICAQTGPD